MSALNTIIHSFRIRSDVDDPTIHRVYMDGEEVQGVKRATVIYEPQELPVVRLEMSTRLVELDAAMVETENNDEVADLLDMDDLDYPTLIRKFADKTVHSVLRQIDPTGFMDDIATLAEKHGMPIEKTPGYVFALLDWMKQKEAKKNNGYTQLDCRST